jgi:two-component system sensor histidine kinase UhpB
MTDVSLDPSNSTLDSGIANPKLKHKFLLNFSGILRLPLILKVLIANSVIVGFGAFVGTWLTESVTSSSDNHRAFDLPLALFFTLVGVTLSALVNYAVLRAAFAPLVLLQGTAAAVRAGKWQARAGHSVFSDPQIERLADTFNTMLDTVEQRNLQLQKISGQVISAQEDERKRIARELHDQTAQSLTNLLIRLKLLEKTKSLEDLRVGVEQLRSLVTETMEDVRELSRSLRPTLLDDYGLVAALESYVAGLQRRLSLQVDFVTVGLMGERLPSEVELVCYRVAQEALTNVVKHANARHILVELRRTLALVTVQVKDDGRGFELDHPTSGLGLVGMRERAQLVGGKLHIGSVAGLGTEVRLDVDLSAWQGSFLT